MDGMLLTLVDDSSRACVGSNSGTLRRACCCTGSLEMKSLLNTLVNSVHRNFGKMLLNSKEKGGPFRSLMRDETSVPTKNELKKDA